MSNSKYLDLLLLQYKPLHDTKKSIKKIHNLLIEAKVSKNTVVVCPELSIQDYICIRKNKKLFREAIDISSSAIKSIRKISIQFKIYFVVFIILKIVPMTHFVCNDYNYKSHHHCLMILHLLNAPLLYAYCSM